MPVRVAGQRKPRSERCASACGRTARSASRQSISIRMEHENGSAGRRPATPCALRSPLCAKGTRKGWRGGCGGGDAGGTSARSSPCTPSRAFNLNFCQCIAEIVRHPSGFRAARRRAAEARQTSLCPPLPKNTFAPALLVFFDGEKHEKPSPQPRREGCGGEELRRLRWSSPPQCEANETFSIIEMLPQKTLRAKTEYRTKKIPLHGIVYSV